MSRKPQPKPEAKPRHVRERVLVTAEQWQARLAALDRMAAKEREEFDRLKRLEVSLTEDRIQALALLRERFGAGEEGWRRAAELGGCSWWTYRDWADEAKNVQPRDQSFKRTAIVLGLKYGFHG